jgi:hypothetical protein
MDGGGLKWCGEWKNSEGSAQHQAHGFERKPANRYGYGSHHQPHSYSRNFNHLCISMPSFGQSAAVYQVHSYDMLTSGWVLFNTGRGRE